MIAITGANGQLGRLVINSLIEKTQASNIVALVRSLDDSQFLTDLGVEAREADYDRPETLTEALVGVEKLLLISSNAVGQRVPQHKAVIEAAKNAGIGLFAYTSILKADTSPLMLAEEHKVTEALIRESGLPAVILRNGWYTENYTQSLQAAVAAGAVVGAAGDGVFHTASRKDYADAAASVLTTSKDQAGKVYELAGDEGFTLREYAAAIGAKIGKSLEFNNLAADEFAEVLQGVGIPEGFAQALADSEIHAQQGWLADNSKTLSTLLGRPTSSLTDSIAAAL